MHWAPEANPTWKARPARPDLASQPARPTHCGCAGPRAEAVPAQGARSVPTDPRGVRPATLAPLAMRPGLPGSRAAPSGGRPPGGCAVPGSRFPDLVCSDLSPSLRAQPRNACTRKGGVGREGKKGRAGAWATEGRRKGWRAEEELGGGGRKKGMGAPWTWSPFWGQRGMSLTHPRQAGQTLLLAPRPTYRVRACRGCSLPRSQVWPGGEGRYWGLHISGHSTMTGWTRSAAINWRAPP